MAMQIFMKFANFPENFHKNASTLEQFFQNFVKEKFASAKYQRSELPEFNCRERTNGRAKYTNIWCKTNGIELIKFRGTIERNNT